ncbi:actin-like ATPase domain-containing protein [Xylona heveae TC161]|uniref:Actin-like ATPase domain-containing protein n=1 Tax=Xylona heveae (strain CBS 132557 / TC161) TaxID=1328760 RepID=A0A165HXR8_XYLHT|nr:actin-like ATPase domain-containing protein [Xylona heveae TC161]KZF24074.1 actin-like ATPase domain-containing protein [Xylona heveae TC161]
MAAPGRRRANLPMSTLTILLCCIFLFTSTASAASAVLGIDLGTEYLKAALVKPGIPFEIVLSKDSKRKETSAVAFKPLGPSSADAKAFPERLYGSDALALAARFPGDVYPNLKPLLGAILKDNDIVDEYVARHPALDVVRDEERHTVAFKSQSFADKEDPFLVEELLAMELKNVRENAEILGGQGTVIRDAVVTVPASFTATEKRALELAAELAGLRILSLVSDGMAVGLNYATSRTFPSVSAGEKPEYHLVFDMGAGSTSATVLRFQAMEVKDVGRFNKTVQDIAVLGLGWDNTLGGDAMNGIVVDDMVERFMDSPRLKQLGATKEKVKSHGRTASKLLKEAERVRQILSANADSIASFEGLYEDVDFKYKITRADFEKLTASYADRIEVVVQNALDMAKLTTKDINSVILHGGAIRTPFVQKKLESILGDAGKVRGNVNSDEAAVFGAAFKGAGISPSFRVKDIRNAEAAGHAVAARWVADGKDRQQKLFLPTSRVGAEKQVPFKKVEDFSFSLFQQKPSSADGLVFEVPVIKVQTQNLTSSVAQLIDQFGCSADAIDTKFSIRLSPKDGLPEVLQGTVSCEVDAPEKKGGMVDDVKGFFGFGSKKGEQESLKQDSEAEEEIPAETETESTTSASTSTSSTSVASSSTSAVPSVKSAGAKKTEVINLSFTIEQEGHLQPSGAELKRIKERLAAFDASDLSRLLREESFNTLEAFTYRARDLLDDEAFISASTSTERSEIESQLSDTSEWLYDEGASAPRDVLDARLKSLTDLTGPVQRRIQETNRRPALIENLQEALNRTKQFIAVVEGHVKRAEEAASSSASSASSSSSSSPSSSSSTTPTPSSSSSAQQEDDFADLEDEPTSSPSSTSESTTTTSTTPTPSFTPPVYSAEDLDSLSTAYDSIKTWLTSKLAEQDRLTAHDDPVLLSADVDAKAQELDKVIMDLVSRQMRSRGSNYGGSGGSGGKSSGKASGGKSKSKKAKKSKTTSASSSSSSSSTSTPASSSTKSHDEL